MRWNSSFLKGLKLIIVVMVALLTAQQEIYAAKRCPCDIFKDGGTPCVAAHSVIRSLYSSYNGPLYQVSRGSNEAEAAARSGTAAVATNNKEYTGTGFVVGFANSTTAQVLFTITAPSAGQYSVLVRYSAGSGASSNIGLFVNGTQITALSFPATSAWDEWSTMTHTVTLNAGSNTIAYKAVTSSATSINLDNISIPSIDKKDIYPLTPGGYANVAVVDSFLKGTTGGTVSKIYDQSEKKNDVTVSLWGSARTYPEKETPATRFKDTISRHIVYPLYMESGEGYRNNHTNGVATGAQPEGMYVVASGTHVNNGCCWDYGNAESDAEAGGKKTGVMEALYFGSSCWFSPCNGSGPWMFADLEWGLFQGSATNGTTNTSLPYEYVAGYLKGDKTTYTIRAADATSATLKLMGTTNRPAPNILTGAVILGIGGDSAPSGRGTFFEGAMTIGRPADSTEDAVQKDISLVYSHKDTVVPVGVQRVAEKLPVQPQAIARYNPSTGSTVISYVLQDAARVSLTILDQRGRQIAAMVNGVRPAGRNEAVWESGRLPAGVYIWKIIADGRDGGAGKIVVGK